MPKLAPGDGNGLGLLIGCCMLKAGTGFPGLAGGNQVEGSKIFKALGADVEGGPASNHELSRGFNVTLDLTYLMINTKPYICLLLRRKLCRQVSPILHS